jgi:hypothetical protein
MWEGAARPDWDWLLPCLDRNGVVVAWTLVDPLDYPDLLRRAWALKRHATHSYAVTAVQRRAASLHRLLLGLATGDGYVVDHVNGDTLDNRRANLRIGTQAQNMQNVRAKHATSRHRGVSLHKPTGLWQAQVQLRRERHHLGYFKDELEAADVAATFRREHMEFAVDR